MMPFDKRMWIRRRDHIDGCPPPNSLGRVACMILRDDGRHDEDCTLLRSCSGRHQCGPYEKCPPLHNEGLHEVRNNGLHFVETTLEEMVGTLDSNHAFGGWYLLKPFNRQLNRGRVRPVYRV